MIDAFDRARFEAALPSVAGQPLWQALGLRDRELCYIIPVRPGILIYVRSSLASSSGPCADSGEDSIRAWLCSDDAGTPLGSKNERWISRVNGWDKRLIETLRALWRVGSALGKRRLNCPTCGGRVRALKVRKPGANRGRYFAGCPGCDYFDAWLTPLVASKGERK